MVGKKVWLGVKIVLVSLFLAAIVGIVVIREMHTFRASVRGRVNDQQGNPIPGAKVSFALPDTDRVTFNGKGTTSQSGMYLLALPTVKVALDSSPNYYRDVHISANGYASFHKCIKLDKGMNTDLNFTLTKSK